MYEAKSVAVQHVHVALVFQGAKAPSDPEFEARALEIAKRRTKLRAPVELRALIVPPDSFDSRREYKVDLSTHTLVSEPSEVQR